MNNLNSIQKEDIQLYNTREKWYVRKEWLISARNRLQNKGEDFIKYFTLTCTMGYDVRFFTDHNLIPKSDVKYDPDFLMFCERKSHKHTLIKNKLPGAQDFPGTFEDLVGAGSVQIIGKTAQTFPFDVINIDINGAPFGGASKIFLIDRNAMEKLFYIQRGTSFTLFLTVRAHRDWDDNRKITELGTLLQQNREQINEYDEYFQNSSELEHHKLLLIMIPKLVIRSGFPYFDVVCTRKFTYVGGDNVARMVSFIFECNYIENNNNVENQKRQRLIEALDHETEDINSILENNASISTECQSLVERYTPA